MTLNVFNKLRKSNPFLNASFVYILANGVGQGTTLLANIFFTRHMTQSDYGMYSNYYSYVALLVPFVGMNMYCGLSNAYIDFKDDIHKLRSSILMLSIVGLGVTSVILFLLNHFVGLSLSYICIFLSLFHAYGFFLVNYYITSMNMENKYINKGLMLLAPNILQAVLSIGAVIICNTYESRAIGGTIGVLLCGVIASIGIFKAARPKINLVYWRYVLKISLPAIIGSVAAMIMQQCDKVMITSIIGPDETAVYALIYNIGYILYAVMQATSGVWQVWLYDTLDKGMHNAIGVIQKWYMYIMLVIATLLYMIAPEIIKILSPKTYWKFDYVAPFIIGSYLMFMYSLHISINEYYKRTGINSIIVLLASGINIVLNYVLIPKYSGIGAAYTSVISYFLIFAVSGLYLYLKKQYYFNTRYIIVDGSIVVIMGVTFGFVKDNVALRYLIYILVLVFEGVYALRKKDELYGIIIQKNNKDLS